MTARKAAGVVVLGTIDTAPIGYSMAGAARSLGHESISAIRKAIDRGDLTPRYANARPIILHDDLMAWVRSLPVDRP